MTYSDSVGSAAGIPTYWAPDIMAMVRTPLVFQGLTTREYEGEIRSAGDVVKVVSTSHVTVENYVRGIPFTGENLVLAAQEIPIEYQKRFAFITNKLDQRQVLPDYVAQQASDATYELKKTRDSIIAAAMKAGCAADNVLGTYAIGLGPNDADIYELLGDAATALDETDTPAAGNMPSMEVEGGPQGGFRFAVLPPFACQMITSGPARSSFGTTENLKTYGDRYIGRTVQGLEIFKSNQCPVGDTGAAYRDVIFGWSRATAFCGQMLDMEDQFVPGEPATLHFGIDVYGTKTVRASQMGRFEIVKAA